MFNYSSSSGVWAYAYIKSIVDLYFSLALANWGAKGSMGQESNS